MDDHRHESAEDHSAEDHGHVAAGHSASPGSYRVTTMPALSQTSTVYRVPFASPTTSAVAWTVAPTMRRRTAASRIASLRRSGHDFVGDQTQITEYSLYRRVDGESIVGDAGADPEQSHLNPPGWDFVMNIPADAEDDYSVVAPTLIDSTEAGGVQFSTFMVRARVAPGVFFDSPPDSGYSIDNLAPSAPLHIVFNTPTELTWDEAPEVDFAFCR